MQSLSGYAKTADENKLLSFLECGCWFAVILIPVLYYLNGPSVSHDQFLVRTAFGVLVGVGALVLRFYRWRTSGTTKESSSLHPSERRPAKEGMGESAERKNAIQSRPNTSLSPACNKRIRAGVVSLLLAVHGLLLCIQAWRNTPTYDEVAHLPSGLSHWKSGNFDLYRVNPPLIRLLATAPLLLANLETDWSHDGDDVFARPEFSAGGSFLGANGATSFWYFTLARFSVIPVVMLGAWLAYRWATELYGWVSGLVALMLWCFCPNLLGWGAQITPDAAAASLGVLAAWLFWRWLRCPHWQRALLAGIGLGLAELTKFSWIVLFALWPMLWLVWRVSLSRADFDKPRIAGLAVILLVAVYLLNVAYGFENSCQRLGHFTFISRTLGGEYGDRKGGNRFSETILGRLPIPLPANFVRGIDVQKHDFEEGKWSYLRGVQKKGGWWYYYLYALLIKTPLGFLALFVLSVLLGISRREYRVDWRDEIVLLCPALVLLLLVSSQTGFNRYIRYVIPALPFLYISIARLGRAFTFRHCWIRMACIIALAAGITSSVMIFPYSMSYFNCAVGGPIGGKRHLLDANLDWGQDLLELKHWLEEHPQSNPIRLAHFGIVWPEVAEIRCLPVPPAPEFAKPGQQAAPVPGWYAISVNHLMGYRHYENDTPCFTYFQQLKPVATIGYSIYIYHIGDSEQALLNRYFSKKPSEGE